MWRACSSIRLSISSNRLSSGDLSGMRTFGRTLSPGLYFWRISSFSFSGFALSGFAVRYMSSKVLTVALWRVSRTDARQDGQVNLFEAGAGGLGDVSATVCCHPNQSFRHEPQKVCRQSRRVKGWKRMSVQIEQVSSFSKSTPGLTEEAIAAYK